MKRTKAKKEHTSIYLTPVLKDFAFKKAGDYGVSMTEYISSLIRKEKIRLELDERGLGL